MIPLFRCPMCNHFPVETDLPGHGVKFFCCHLKTEFSYDRVSAVEEWNWIVDDYKQTKLSATPDGIQPTEAKDTT
jgi:transcription elongation factor Elf1